MSYLQAGFAQLIREEESTNTKVIMTNYFYEKAVTNSEMFLRIDLQVILGSVIHHETYLELIVELDWRFDQISKKFVPCSLKHGMRLMGYANCALYPNGLIKIRGIHGAFVWIQSLTEEREFSVSLHIYPIPTPSSVTPFEGRRYFQRPLAQLRVQDKSESTIKFLRVVHDYQLRNRNGFTYAPDSQTYF